MTFELDKDYTSEEEASAWYLDGQAFYGGCICPGENLSPITYTCPCNKCGMDASYTEYERIEGGAINLYKRVSCDHCGNYSDNGDCTYD